MQMPKSFAPQAVTISCSQVLNTLVHVIAPVLPHLAEEIYSVLRGKPSSEISHESSVFSKPWVPLVLLCLYVVIRVSLTSSQSSDWHDPTAEQEMVQLLRVRSMVLGLLEQARGRRFVVPLLLYAAGLNVNIRQLSSSTEAEVDIILPSIRNDLTSLIKREGMSFIRILEHLYSRSLLGRIFPQNAVYCLRRISGGRRIFRNSIPTLAL